jgi:hypothetical protein
LFKKDKIMINDSEEVVVEDAPRAKPRITPVIVLSVLLGGLMTVVAVGSVFSYQRAKAVNAEMQTLKNELKEKSRVHDDLQQQIEALSRQMDVLKEYSVARSNAPAPAREARAEAELNNKAEGKADVKADVKAGAEVVTAPSAPAVSVVAPPARDKLQASEAPVQPVVIPRSPEPAKMKRSKPDGQSCELVGKSAEEQAAILKRCVGLMDAPKDVKGRK